MYTNMASQKASSQITSKDFMIAQLQMLKIQLLREGRGRGNNVQKNKSVFHIKNAMISSFFTTKWLLLKSWPGEKRLGRISFATSYREHVSIPHIKTMQKYSRARGKK